MLPGGGDWLRVGTDGVGRIDVRATIRTHDGELVLLTNTGVIAIAEQALGAVRRRARAWSGTSCTPAPRPSSRPAPSTTRG